MIKELSKNIDKYLQNRGEYDLPKHLRMEWINAIPTKDATNDKVIIARIEELLGSESGRIMFFEYFLQEYKNLVTKHNKTYEEYRICDAATDLLKKIAFLKPEHEISEEEYNEIKKKAEEYQNILDKKTEDAPSEGEAAVSEKAEANEKPQKATGKSKATSKASRTTKPSKTTKAAEKKADAKAETSAKRGRKASTKAATTEKDEKSVKTTGAKRGRKPKAEK